MFESKTQKAPSTNRGPKNTLPKSLTSCVDWFSCTFLSCKNWQEIAGVFFIDLDKFEVSDGGFNGYKKKAVYNHIQIFFDGTPAMGVFINLSGQGCRQMEEILEFLSMDWKDFFGYVRGFHINITRLDIAIDDFQGIFKIKQLESALRRGCVISKFRNARNFETIKIETGKTEGQTLYFGKKDVVIRFYDKYQERLAKNKIFNDDITFWNRTELQLRGDRAKSAIDIIVDNNHDLGEFVKGVLNRYIAFKVKGTDSNKSRWNNARWWNKFLGDVEKISLSMQAPDKSVLRTKHWLDSQVAGSLATVYEALGDDKLFLDYLVGLGKTKMSDDQKKMSDDFRCDVHKRIALKEELREAVSKIEGKKRKPIEKEIDFARKREIYDLSKKIRKENQEKNNEKRLSHSGLGLYDSTQ